MARKEYLYRITGKLIFEESKIYPDYVYVNYVLCTYTRDIPYDIFEQMAKDIYDALKKLKEELGTKIEYDVFVDFTEYCGIYFDIKIEYRW